jgi:hypothetical protein
MQETNNNLSIAMMLQVQQSTTSARGTTLANMNWIKEV